MAEPGSLLITGQVHLSRSVLAQSNRHIPGSAANLAIFNVLLKRSPTPVDPDIHRLTAEGTGHACVVLERGHRMQKGAASPRPQFACR